MRSMAWYDRTKESHKNRTLVEAEVELTLTFRSRHLEQESSCRGCAFFFLLSREVFSGDTVAARWFEEGAWVLDGPVPLSDPDIE